MFLLILPSSIGCVAPRNKIRCVAPRNKIGCVTPRNKIGCVAPINPSPHLPIAWPLKEFKFESLVFYHIVSLPSTHNNVRSAIWVRRVDSIWSAHLSNSLYSSIWNSVLSFKTKEPDLVHLMAADDEEDDDVSISELQLHSNDIPTSPVPESLLLEDDEDDMPGKWFFKLEVLMKRKWSFSYSL